MLKAVSLSLLIICLLSNCAHGPKVSSCSSDPVNAQFDCADAKGVVSVVAYKDSTGYVAESEGDAQNLIAYCDARFTPGTPAPQFSSCTSDYAAGGFDCVQQICQVNTSQNGILCTKGTSFFVPYSASLKYQALSPTDSRTLLEFCNISL